MPQKRINEASFWNKVTID